MRPSVASVRRSGVVPSRHTSEVDAPTLQLLEWISETPRSYPETIEAWKSSCPRLTVWEDAVAGGLVRVERGSVVLTPAGSRRLLDAAGGQKEMHRAGGDLVRLPD
jgi:hypothetical protein